MKKKKQSKRPVFETYPFSVENIDSINLTRLAGSYQVEIALQEKLKTVVETIIRITNAEKLFWSGFTISEYRASAGWHWEAADAACNWL